MSLQVVPESRRHERVVRPMHFTDLEAVAALEARTFTLPWSLAIFSGQLARETGICLVCEDDGRIIAYLIADMFVDVWHLMNLCVAQRGPPRARRLAPARGVLRDHRAQGPPRPHAGGPRLQRRRRSSCTAASGSSPPASAPGTTATTARTRSSCGRTGKGTRRERPSARWAAAGHGSARRPHPRRRDVLRRHQRGRRPRARGAVVDRLVPERAARAVRRRGAGGGLTPPHGAGQRGGRRGDERGRRRLGRPRRRRRDAGPRAHRRAPRRAGDGEVARLPARAAADPGQPPAGSHRRQLRPRRGGAVRVPGRQRRAHAARGRRGGRALPRRRQDHGRRGRRGVRQGRPAARARLPGRQGARRAGGARRPGLRPLPARRAQRPRLQLQRPQDGAALRPQGPRRGGDRGASRRHRRLVPGGHRPPARGEDDGRRRRRGAAQRRRRRRRGRQLRPAPRA